MLNLRDLEERAADALGRVGERYSIDWLIYSPLRMHSYHLLAKEDAPAVVRSLREVFPHARVFVDVGCGSGAYAHEINSCGLIALGCEKSRVGRCMAKIQGVDVRAFDLGRPDPVPLPKMSAGMPPTFDIAYCIEVAEHLPADLGDRLVRLLCELAPTVVFTAAQPGQGGAGHLNEQPGRYWEERFRRLGFELSRSRTDELAEQFVRRGVSYWLPENVLVFQQ